MTFTLDSLAMEAAHAALALADPANSGLVHDPWGAPPQVPFNYAWGRAAATAQNAVVAAAANDAAAAAVSANDTLEAARRGRGRPKKDPADAVGAAASAKAASEKQSNKPPPIRGRGRPPRTSETNDPSASALYEKFPLPPGLQAPGWPLPQPPTTSSGHAGVNLTRDTSAGASSYPASNPCCSTASGNPAHPQHAHDHHHQHQHPQGHHGERNGHGSAENNRGSVASNDVKVHPTYPPFSVHAPGPTCFPGKQMFMVNAPITSPPPPLSESNNTPSFKQSPGSTQNNHQHHNHHQKKSKQSANNSTSENNADSMALVPKPISLGGTNVGCPICFKIFGNKGLLSQHMLVHTDVRKHACLYCDKSFKQQSHLKAHVRIHTGERPYKCTMPDCGRDFVQMANLQFHLRNHESQRRRATEEKTGYVRPPDIPDPTSHRERVRCPICYKGFDSGLGLERHMFDFHEPAVIDQELSLSNSNSSN